MNNLFYIMLKEQKKISSGELDSLVVLKWVSGLERVIKVD